MPKANADNQAAPSASFAARSPGMLRIFQALLFVGLLCLWYALTETGIKIAIVGMAIWTQLWPERGALESILTQSPGGVVSDMNHLLFKVLTAALSG